MEGEVKIPESLKEFYKIFYTGNANEQCSARISHMMEGSSAEAIYACSGGKLIPGKHLTLGLNLKSLTGSKTMVSLLNCLGHCASDEIIRRIDLGLDETLFKTKTLVPSHIIRKSNLSSGLHGTILISTSKHHLGQKQYTIHMEFVTRTRCRSNKFKF